MISLEKGRFIFFNSIFYKKNIAIISFFLTLSICFILLFLTSILEIKDFSTTIGFSSKNFDYSLFSDGQFYKDSLDFYTKGNFVSKKGFVAGPIVPFILSKLSFQSLTLLFTIFSFLVSLAIFFWVKLIDKFLKLRSISLMTSVLLRCKSK